MSGFDHLLNWKLKRGSHRFPDKGGGTCINEAALVAAGFEYKQIRSAEEMPECFSRPICRFAMWLNDMASDEERQCLLPFVIRLACADSLTVECIREHYIATRVGHGLTFERGLDILEGALAIGRQADVPGPETVKSRMADVQARATTATSVPDPSLLSTIKGWVGATKQPEAVT